MKVRKLAVALALVGGLGSGLAHALGLGEVELQSYLNEPLDADIGLRNSGEVDASDVYVTLAAPEVFERVGVDREFFLTNLQFEVKTSPDGQLVVNITSRQAVREPYLNFLIEVTWPSGRLLREYSLLLDPPVYAEQSGSQQSVQPAQTAATGSDRSAGSQDTTGGGSDRAAASESGGTTFGPTDSSDTLWEIALAVRPNDSYSPQQVMLALQDLNPQAFMNGNINRLKRGQVLRIPSADQINRRTNSQAYSEVTAQNDALEKLASAVDGTDQQTSGSEEQSQQASGDELRLLAADDTATSAKDGASAGGEDGVAGGAENAGNNVATLEKLDKAERENSELNSRVDDLESQLDTLQRLIELKNNQLAEMQNQSGSESGSAQGQGASSTDQETVSTPEATTTAEPVASDGDTASEAGDGTTAMAGDGQQANATDNALAADGNATETGDGAQASAGADSDGATEGAGADASGDTAMMASETSDADAGMADSQMSAEGQDQMAADSESAGGDAGTDGMAADQMAADDAMAGTSASGDTTGADEMEAGDGGGQAGQDEQRAEGMVASNGTDNQSGQSGSESPGSGDQPDTGGQGDADSTQTAANDADATGQDSTSDQVADASTETEADRGLIGNLIHGLKTNPVYQVIAGIGAVALLLLLLLLARRNANRDKAFYDELDRDAHGDSDHFDFEMGGDSDPASPDHGEESDALSEADAYVAYGRYDQAAEVLENAISKEPSRTDLRLKLLAVYADGGNRDAFERQYGELETLDDEPAMDEAQTLRTRLDESESTPSIDELESQLRSGTGATASADNVEQPDWNDPSLSRDFGGGYESEDATASGETFGDQRGQQDHTIDENLETALDGRSDETEDELGDAFSELDDDSVDIDDTAQAEEHQSEAAAVEASNAGEDSKDAPIEYDLSGLELDDEEEISENTAENGKPRDVSERVDSMDDLSTSDTSEIDFELDDESAENESDELTEDDFGSLELDDEFAEQADEKAAENSERATSDDEEPAINEEPELATDENGNLDESFLDDLDAELEKVAGEDSEESTSSDEDSLDELELDVSDEDLALMEEVAEKPEADKPESSDVADSEDGEIPELGQPADGQHDSLDLQNEADEPTADTAGVGETLNDEPERHQPAIEPEDFDEAVLDDDDDFDFLAGTDEAATKLDLARAYVEMGDSDGARDILEEVSIEGDDTQKSEAQTLLKSLA